MPYNGAAVDWSDVNFDHVYKAAWWSYSAITGKLRMGPEGYCA